MTVKITEYTESLPSVNVTVQAHPDGHHTVITTWFDGAGNMMTTGRKDFTGDMAWADAAAFANSILMEEWGRNYRDSGLPVPTIFID